MIDVAAVAPIQLATVVDRGLANRLIHISHLEVATRPAAEHRQRGIAVLRAHLHERGHLGAPHPSVLESLMMREVFHRHRLPVPQSEVVAGWFGQYRIDFAYPELMLAIEVDGYVWHSNPEHMEADNARRNHLRTLGWHVLVYTWVQVTRNSEGTAAEILANYRRLTAG
jgi:REase_MTES_1575